MNKVINKLKYESKLARRCYYVPLFYVVENFKINI